MKPMQCAAESYTIILNMNRVFSLPSSSGCQL